MNIVVIEDESKVRQGIVKLINEEFDSFHVIGEASNGLDGYELVKNTTAEIVITDIKMPKLNGIEMIRRLKDEGIDKYFVILSGYADFQYAKEAIRFGVSEYLLKPITVDDLKEVLTKIEVEHAKSTSNPNDIFQTILMNGEGDARVIQEYMKADRGYLAMFYLKEKQSIEPFLDELCLFTPIKLNEGCIYVVLFKDRADILPMLQETVKSMNQSNTCICSYIGIDDFSQIGACYGVLKKLVKWSISLKENIISQEIIDKHTFKKLEYPHAIEKQAIQVIYNGKLEQLKEITGQFIRYFEKEMYSPGDVMEAYLTYSTNLVNNLRKVYTYALQDISQAVLLDHLLNCYTYDQLENWLIQLLDSILPRIDHNKVSLVVYKALEIIHNEYNKDVNLESVAERIHVTSEYLSSLFNKEMNKNFLYYLTEYRINIAKELLLKGRLKTQDIANSVGYTSEKYFFSVFKKVTGMSPGKYVMTHKGKE